MCIVVELIRNSPNNFKTPCLNVKDNDSFIPLSFIFLLSREHVRIAFLSQKERRNNRQSRSYQVKLFFLLLLSLSLFPYAIKVIRKP
jgi:hypothetical protein